MDEASPEPTAETHPGMPRWLRVSLVVLVVVVLALVAFMALAGGDHGPGRHATGNDAAVTVTAGPLR